MDMQVETPVHATGKVSIAVLAAIAATQAARAAFYVLLTAFISLEKERKLYRILNDLVNKHVLVRKQTDYIIVH